MPENLVGIEAYRAKVSRSKRAAILDGALDVFLEVGYSAATMAGIAERAGVSTATLYKHFTSKSELLGSVVENVYEEMSRTWSWEATRGMKPEEALSSLARHYTRQILTVKIDALMRVVIAEVMRFPELGLEFQARGMGPRYRNLENYLTEQVKLGTLKINDVPLAARHFTGMVNENFFWPRLLDVTLETSEKELDHIIDEAVTTFMARYGA